MRKVSVLSINSLASFEPAQRRGKRGIKHGAAPTKRVALQPFYVWRGSCRLVSSLPLCVKWWRYLFWFIMQVSLVYASILYHLANCPLFGNRRPYGTKYFRVGICHGLAAGSVCKDKWKVQLVISKSDHQIDRLHGRKAACYYCTKSGNKTNSGRTLETIHLWLHDLQTTFFVLSQFPTSSLPASSKCVVYFSNWITFISTLCRVSEYKL